MSFFDPKDYTLIRVPRLFWNLNHSAIADWCMTLPDDDYEWSKEYMGYPNFDHGIYFRYERDVIIFKLKFGV